MRRAVALASGVVAVCLLGFGSPATSAQPPSRAPPVPVLKSASAVVVDQATGDVLLEKDAALVLPIASITKLMTALVVLEEGLDLDEVLTVMPEDRAGGVVRSRLAPGTTLARSEALQLALMASENRAALLLGRTFPGGVAAAVDAMNARAALLGMSDAHFADPTGLSPDNRASARDLVKLVLAAHEQPLMRAYTTQGSLSLKVGPRVVRWGNTNRLTGRPDWDIGLQKTGYISAAGRCLVMQSTIAGRGVVMVLLDSVGRLSRLGDAQRVRSWLESLPPTRSTQPTP